jgi:hypothetical protein
MKPARLVGAIAALVVAALPIASAGTASTGTVDLSTDQAVVSYLVSLGIDPTGVVIQRGAKNYAGPKCPGAGWTCTTATKVVQVGQPGGQNRIECGPGATAIPDSYTTGTTLTPSQILQLTSMSALSTPLSACIAVQANAQTNSFKCVRRDGTPEEAALQECDVTQPGVDDNATASNRAFVLMIIDQNVGPTQDGTQRSKIRQVALGSASNFAHVIQSIKQSTKIGSTQIQEGHQASCTVQLSDAGAEFSQAIQSIAQKEMTSGPPDQNQNTQIRPKTCEAGAPGDTAFTSNANTLALVRQDSTSGRLTSHVNQSHNLDATAKGMTGNQTQGTPPAIPQLGGLEGRVFQDSTGHADSFGLQNEDQSLFGNSPTIVQKQFGPFRCCSDQSSDLTDNVLIAGRSAQRALVSSNPLSSLAPAVPNPSALQETLGIGHFDTTGDGRITHQLNQNGGSDTATCPPTGASTSEDGSSTCDLVTFGLNGVFFAEFPPPICGEGEVFNPETGECEPVYLD